MTSKNFIKEYVENVNVIQTENKEVIPSKNLNVRTKRVIWVNLDTLRMLQHERKRRKIRNNDNTLRLILHEHKDMKERLRKLEARFGIEEKRKK